MRVLVTGCAGFIGSHLAERLVELGHDVVGIDCFINFYPRLLKMANLERLQQSKHFSLVELDLATADLSSVCAGAELVFHQAAQAGVRGSWGPEFEIYTRNNVLATQRLLEALKGQPLHKFVYASSSSIYGDAEAFPTSELALPKPVSPYGATKLAGEHLCYLYWRNYNLPTVALRYFTVYGPRQRPDMGFHKFIRATMEDRAIQIYGDGEQTRDFTFVSDAVAANLAAGTADAVGTALNIGGGSRVTVNHVLRLLGEIIGQTPRVDYIEAQAGDVRHTSADTRAAQQAFGYNPRVSLAQGLRAEFEWIQGLAHLTAS